MVFIKLCNKVIKYSFYSLFFFVPLAFTDKTSELFEFNKMWLTFGFTIVIGAAWFIKMILQRRILFCRTPLDLPILLFLLSQFISTLFSLDIHTSIWGYYSRFNGGLLSIISYIFLYYAFISNLSHLGNLLVKRLLLISLISGAVVALWGLPSHFGYDPTCLIFRGNFDVSCWTDAFQPKVRIFSTLGQPNWMAAYLSILLPIAIAMAIKNFKCQISNVKFQMKNKNIGNWKFEIGNYLKFIVYFILTILFYFDLLYTNSQSGYIGSMFSIALMTIFILLTNIKNKLSVLKAVKENTFKILGLFVIAFILIAFFVGQPISALNKFSLPQLLQNVNKQTVQSPKSAEPQGPALEVGGTNSGKIRLIVWKGALDIWKNNPVFGSGVETFAFAYYRYRPSSHNLTSEWDYLYNKAHNEYLNYLATTGIFGLGSYLLMIGSFSFIVFKKLKSQNSRFEAGTLNFALLASYVSILISNFFGFSVVIVNLYFFLIPAFVLIFSQAINPEKALSFPKINIDRHPEFISGSKIPKQALPAGRQVRNDKKNATIENKISGVQWTAISLTLLTSLYFTLILYRFWSADTDYALGSNYNKIGEYETANIKLVEAVKKRSSEPVFKDELSSNKAALSLVVINKKDATSAANLIKEAVDLNNHVIAKHPNNVVFWKTRVKMFYLLGQLDQTYLQFALDSIIKAKELAPTDAKISYNLGVLYGQTGNNEKAIETLKDTIKLKPDYRDAYFAMGLFYHEAAIDKDEKIIKPDMQQKAVETMNYILANFSRDDKPTREALEKWNSL